MKILDKCVENVIGFMKDEQRATVTFSQGRYKSRIKKLAAERPEECQIMAENQDGSMCVHIPVSWIKISPLREMSEENKQQARERMIAYHSKCNLVIGEKG